MIFTKLQGGLGNQMFQYAFGRQLAINNNSDLLLDLSFYSSKHNFAEADQRVFVLNNFSINAKIIEDGDVKKIVTNKYFKKIGLIKKNHIIEKKLNFSQPELLTLKGDYFFDGYWQTEKYFLNIRDVLLKEFTLKQDLVLCNDLSNWLNSGVTVSLHCRRGDYLTSSKVKDVYNFCSLDYYQEALKILSNKLHNFKLLIFSDDPGWVKNNLKFDLETKFVSDYKLKDYQELILMSRCKHQIIANSSFSWWGAWLNNNLEKIVITPDKWFNESTLNYNDIVPDNWLKIKV